MKPFFETDEHEQLGDAAHRYVESVVSPSVEEWERTGIPREALAAIAEAGFVGVHYPEELGGQGGDLAAAVPVVEAVSRCRSGGFVTSYLVQAHLATSPLARRGSAHQQAEFLRPALAGDRLGCLAITEPDAGSDVAALRTTARRHGSDWLINGAKQFITNGGIADYALLAARCSEAASGSPIGSIGLFIVETDQAGYQASSPLSKLGCDASQTVSIFLEDVRVPADRVLGESHAGFKYIMEGFVEERLVSALYACESGLQVLEDTANYLADRTAFGEPLLNKQAPRHQLAQLKAELTAVQQLTYASIWAVIEGSDQRETAAMCKLLSAEAANRAAYYAVQFFGGLGYMDETWVSRYYRDIRMYSIGGGASEIQREIISRGLRTAQGSRSPL